MDDGAQPSNISVQGKERCGAHTAVSALMALVPMCFTVVFGTPLLQLLAVERRQVPLIVDMCIQYLRKEGTSARGNRSSVEERTKGDRGRRKEGEGEVWSG